jgi:hypothetical protein
VEIENPHTKSLYMRSGSADQAGRKIPAYWNLRFAFRDISVQQDGGHKLHVVLVFLQSLGLDCGC